ncbi:MAG: aldehyde dehydrogenase family protein [Kofleriaceae bacterium]
MRALGNFIDRAFVAPAGALVSRNPAADGQPVLETAFTVSAVATAAAAAAAAAAGLGRARRRPPLGSPRALQGRDRRPRHRAGRRHRARDRQDRSEAKVEIQTLLNRFDLARGAIAADLRPGPVAGATGEALRYQALGVVGVIGPFNFPLHLCHAHVVPALLAGNTVVIKPSDLTPLCGQRYAEAAEAAGLPPGVLNMVVGTGAVGAAMLEPRAVHGLCFTGSWGVGRRILEAALDRPDILVALEMGGKNCSVVLDDASLRQAVHEIVVGGYLSAGQRCTGTDRVLVHRSIADRFIAALAAAAPSLRFGPPEDPTVFAGPVVSEGALHKLEAPSPRPAPPAPSQWSPASGQRLVPERVAAPAAGRRPPRPRLHRRRGVRPRSVRRGRRRGRRGHRHPGGQPDRLRQRGVHGVVGALRAVLRAGPHRHPQPQPVDQPGVAAAALRRGRDQRQLPAGGRVGSPQPGGAGGDARERHRRGGATPAPRRRCCPPPPDLEAPRSASTDRGGVRGRAPAGRRSAADGDQPAGGTLPDSAAWLERLYAADRVPKEKKPLVFDHLRSAGPWMVSIDPAPLTVLDGMSQTATVCAGFAEDAVVAAFVEGQFDDTITADEDAALGETQAARRRRHPAPARARAAA